MELGMISSTWLGTKIDLEQGIRDTLEAEGKLPAAA